MPDNISYSEAPHSPEAEQAVLGAIIIDPECIPAVLEITRSKDFYGKMNREIFEAAEYMFAYGAAIDPVTIIDKMNQDGTGGRNLSEYILDIMRLTPTSAHVEHYARIIHEQALRRSLSGAAVDIHEAAISGEGSVDDLLELAERRIYDLREGRSGDALEPISKIIQNVVRSISDASQTDTGMPGVSSGLIDLDASIMGLNKSDLIIIASRPGMGKTSIALNIAINVAKVSGGDVVVFSLEMSREQLVMRLLSSEAEIDNKKLITGRLNAAEWTRLATAAGELSQTKLYINDNPMMTVADMNAQCRRLHNLQLIVVDYLQLMTSAGTIRNSSENRVNIMSEISRMMKIMAKDLNVPVIALSQLSREVEKRQSDKRPHLADLRESGSIEQDADIVLGLYREEYYDKETERGNIADLIILKNRRGETGNIELQWSPRYTRYTSLDRRHTEYRSYSGDSGEQD